MNKAQGKQDAACGACRYYLEQDHGVGTCHRYPPGFAGDQSPRELHRWCFPLVTVHSWCGEFADAACASAKRASSVEARLLP
jgi:hypothetical protein